MDRARVRVRVRSAVSPPFYLRDLSSEHLRGARSVFFFFFFPCGARACSFSRRIAIYLATFCRFRAATFAEMNARKRDSSRKLRRSLQLRRTDGSIFPAIGKIILDFGPVVSPWNEPLRDTTNREQKQRWSNRHSARKNHGWPKIWNDATRKQFYRPKSETRRGNGC